MPENYLPKRPTIYLSGVSTAEARNAHRDGLGILIQPGNSTHLDVDAGHFENFGADNGFYGLGARRDPSPEEETAAVETWARWIDSVVAPRAPRCLFATIPDVLRWIEVEGKRIPVGDAEATLARYHGLVDVARRHGIPAALVAQDGLSFDAFGLYAGAERVAWADVDAIFVGGSDAFKLGADAEAICREARRRGLWVHVGRVNSWKRIDRVRDYADSVDGTFLKFGRKGENWPRLESWLDRLEAGDPDPVLFSVIAA